MKQLERQIRRLATAAGALSVSKSQAGHFKIKGPDWFVCCSSTPRDRDTAVRRIARDLKKKSAGAVEAAVGAM